jgi:hypothetical protein
MQREIVKFSADAGKAALASGFGDEISKLFAGDYVTEQELRADSGLSELRPAITRLLAQMR